jgi:hypothetical protein
MTTAPGHGTELDLCALLSTTLLLTREVANAESTWTTPLADSQAGRELAKQEAHADRPTGSWPWLASLKIARWGLQVAIEVAQGFSVLLTHGGTSYAADVLCRAVLEHTSLTFWLLDPDIDDDGRLARALVYRLHTAGQSERAVDHLQLPDDADRSEYDEVAKEIRSLGQGWTHRRNSSVTHDENTVTWPGYSERVTQLVRHIWPQHKLPYAVLRAVAHAELLGLTRNLATPGHGLDPRPDPAGSALWLWQDTYLALGALLFAAERAAGVLGRTEQLTALHSWTAVLGHTLPALQPDAMDPGPRWR